MNLKKIILLCILVTLVCELLPTASQFHVLAEVAKTYTLKEAKLSGLYILVNKSHLLPSKYVAPDLVYIKNKVPVRFSNLKMNAKALTYLSLMYNAAKKVKINIYVYSAFRTLAEQTYAYKKKVSFYQKNHTLEEAKALASKIVAPPNASEHQTGLAVDIVSTVYRVRDKGFEKSVAGKWLKENSWKYGFILRYPSTKTATTKIIFEPWHFRFIGKILAKKMHSEKVCLEEYLKYNK